MRAVFGAVVVALLALAACTPLPRRVLRAAAPPPVVREIVPAVSNADAGAPAVVAAEGEAVVDTRYAAVDAAVLAAIEAGKMPGCVVVVGRHDEVLLRRAYGSRALVPERVPMTLDTVFDLASLTKPLATSTSIMILAERGKIDLHAPASRYLPELARLPAFTIEQLLTHTSGLPAATPISDYALATLDDHSATMKKLGESLEGKLKTLPGERFLYSDVGFIVLEEIVRRRAGRSLATFAKEEIFMPLGMVDTGYLPEPALRERAAPTEQRDGHFMQGDVHDPRAWAMGGVAGHAGVFSTADDLARYARAMLGKGTLDGKRIVSEKTWGDWTARRDTSSGGRALGWDKDSRFASHRSTLLSPRAFGHGGFTGTVLWIDPGKDLYVVFLSNRVHPDGKGAVNPLVAELATLAIDASETKTGIDVLRAESFERLKGAHVGLVTNASARAKDGTSTLDLLRAASPSTLTLSAIFSPEHGIQGVAEGKIADGTYHGVPVYSLYGDRASPTGTTLDGIDTLVFDLQDAGARFYTYASTMKLAMKVAAERGLRFVVLDRPNPIGGAEVAGPVLAAAQDGTGQGGGGQPTSFVNHHALPVRHGMTMGELARLFADDGQLDLRLDVVRMQGWERRQYFDHTGLTWTSPSPNLRSVDEVVLYPAVGLLESTNLSVGRGTDTPFEVLGAPFIDGEALARNVKGRGIPGLVVEEVTFTPTANPHRGKVCHGLRLRVTERAKFEPVRAAVTIALALQELHPTDWDVDHVDRMLQSKSALDAIKAGKSADAVVATWSTGLAAFVKKREKFLLY
ncbi:MAG: hypothetical protein QOI41_5069 [Myxococcales bacterium]|nr:hypothetical protein [Myxococcales bacterium]